MHRHQPARVVQPYALKFRLSTMLACASESSWQRLQTVFSTHHHYRTHPPLLCLQDGPASLQVHIMHRDHLPGTISSIAMVRSA